MESRELAVTFDVLDWLQPVVTIANEANTNKKNDCLLLCFRFQVHTDFVSAAIRGCQAVVDGNIMAINPGEESKYK